MLPSALDDEVVVPREWQQGGIDCALSSNLPKHAILMDDIDELLVVADAEEFVLI